MIVINSRYSFDSGTITDLNTNHQYELGTNESELLRYFLDHPGDILSKEQLIENVWTKRGTVVEEGSLMTAISLLRKSLGDNKGDIIKTMRGKGYLFVGSVEHELASETSSRIPSVNILKYISVFVVLLIGSYFLSEKLHKKIMSGSELLSGTFEECYYIDPTGKKFIYEHPSIYKNDKISILISSNNHSISYPNEFKEIICK
ncbi:winged helix-turn-helix domain-containing protein [Vibrio sp. S4M6]|uniref:winged helix-turn-helix domain-containing protein n=1 Tax=Vibrio sinus TaxID=2946865 RepID=UPI00202A4289|nr:winged helix-turn-helix domain-containing protein [Vibrio sinus]MCL9782715.1 winged helix-turn-helix domain-containing protein [Vibrio sinus]